MPYVTSIERLAIEKGREEGREEGREQGRTDTLQDSILRLPKTKFKVAGAKYTRKIQAERDSERLQAILDTVACATTLDEVRSVLR
jgi:hypothetical protein